MPGSLWFESGAGVQVFVFLVPFVVEISTPTGQAGHPKLVKGRLQFSNKSKLPKLLCLFS